MIPSQGCTLSLGLLWLHISLAAAQNTDAAVTSPPSSTSSSTALVETISDCELEDQVQHCTSGEEEFFLEIPSSQTDELPSQYTDCHAHDADLFCVGPDGEDVFVQRVDPSLANANEEEEHSDHDDHDDHDGDDHSSHEGEENHSDHEGEEAVGAAGSGGQNCHFHAGVEHCTESEEEEEEASGAAESGGQTCHFHAGVEHCTGSEESSSEAVSSCSRVQRDYDIPLRIGTLFVVLVTSSIGVYGPILLTRALRFKFFQYAFLVLKQFGTGVIISTAFVHLYTHASLMFENDCLGELNYESTTGAIVMTGIIISFAIDYLAHRFVGWQRSKTGADSLARAAQDGSSHTSSGIVTDDRNKIDTSAEAMVGRSAPIGGYSTKLDVIVLEIGIIFHSIILGLTSVLADDSFYMTLFIVVVFHQFFEGVALGTRIADVPYPDSSQPSSSLAYSDSPYPQPRSTLSLSRKLLLALPYSLITPIGMAIGIGVLDNFNGNDRSTIIVIGTLDALSAGILIWVGLVEMLAKDWLHKNSELARAGVGKVLLAVFGGLLPGMILMSLLGKWI